MSFRLLYLIFIGVCGWLAGLAGASFATNLMDRYQVYAIAASVIFVADWLIHLARSSGIHLAQIRRHGAPDRAAPRRDGRCLRITLAAAFGASILIRNL